MNLRPIGLAIVVAATLATVWSIPGGAQAHDRFPHVIQTMTNTTGEPANHLQVTMGNVGASLNPVSANAPGCPTPTVVVNSLIPISRYVIVWPEECVDPGESITFHSDTDCPACSTPTVNAFEYSSTFVEIANDTGSAADGLHVNLASDAHKVPSVVNVPGCSTPAVDAAPPPFTQFNVTWPSACVGPGDSVKIDLYQFDYIAGTDIGCTTCDPPEVASYSWSTGQPPTPRPPGVGGIAGLAADDTAVATTADGGSDALLVPLVIALASALALATVAGWRVVAVRRRS